MAHHLDVNEEADSSLRHYAGVLRRRKWALLVPVVVLPAIMFVASVRQGPVYEASSEVLINRQEVAATSVIGETPAWDDAERSAETHARLAQVPEVARRTLVAAGLSGRSTDDFLNKTDVFTWSDLLLFVARDSDAATAARMASEYAREFAEYKRELDTEALKATLGQLGARIAELEAEGQRGSRLYANLVDREQQLRTLDTLRSSNVFVVKTVSADDVEQIAPRPLRNTAFALVGGLVIGLILVFLWEALDPRVRSRRDLEALLGLPVLAEIDGPHRGPTLATLGEGASSEADAYHLVRLGLDFANVDGMMRTIFVSSTGEENGKSTTAANVAVAFAQAGRRVALVDLNLRSPYLSGVFGLHGSPGVTDVLRKEAELEDILFTVDVASDGRRLDGGVLEVAGTGVLPPRPPELLGSKALGSLLSDLGSRADVVVVDGPPLTFASDVTAVASHVQAVILVSSLRRARRSTLAEARRVLEILPVPKVGVVLTTTGREGGFEQAIPGRRRSRTSEPVTEAVT